MARFFKRAPSREGAQTDAPERQEPAKAFSQIKPDPDSIGISGSVPFVRLPDPGKLFAERAKRFAALAPEHPLGGYLVFLGKVAEAQAAVQAGMAAPAASSAEEVAVRFEHGMPPLTHGMPPLTHGLLGEDPAFQVCLDQLIERVDLTEAPELARAARAALQAATQEDRLDLAVQVFEGAIPVERMAECVFVAAALQVYLAAQAARLDPKALKPVADGICPACGGAPTASLIVAWTQADKARYLSCSTCSTLWNHVRIRCTACGSGEDVAYSSLDEVSKDVQVETCGLCRSYLKHLHQHRAPMLDAIADDVASYGLDLKIAEEGFRRAGLNLLFVS